MLPTSCRKKKSHRKMMSQHILGLTLQKNSLSGMREKEGFYSVGDGTGALYILDRYFATEPYTCPMGELKTLVKETCLYRAVQLLCI